MSQPPETCSAGGYCDCLETLEKLGFWRAEAFWGLEFTHAQAGGILRSSLFAAPELAGPEEFIATACREYADQRTAPARGDNVPDCGEWFEDGLAMTLPQQLIAAREAAGLSQMDAARAAKLDYSDVSRVEDGSVVLDTHSVSQLAGVYGVRFAIRGKA